MDEQGYVQALESLLSEPPRLLSFRQASREIAKKFDLAAIVERYASVYSAAGFIRQKDAGPVRWSARCRKSIAEDSSLFPDLSGGGAERVMVNLAEGFARGGLRVDMVLIRPRELTALRSRPESGSSDLHARNAYTALPAWQNISSVEKAGRIALTLD